MSNECHASLGQQFKRAAWGIFLSLGFGGFWIGLYTGTVLLAVVCGVVLSIGFVKSVSAFSRSKSCGKTGKRSRTPRRH